MPTLSLADGVDASYAVAAGQTSIVVRSISRLKYRAVYGGTGQMIFHWVQEGKTEVWKCDMSLPDAKALQVNETVGQDGSQTLQVGLGDIYPAGLILKGRLVGTLVAPAIHVDVPWWNDIWVFLIRSPWFPLRLQLDRPSLSVKHNVSYVTASIGASADGTAAGQVAFNGTDFKNASLVVKRMLGTISSEELTCETGPGVQAFAWRPITRVFDLVLVTKGHISESQLADVAKGLGAQISPGFLGPGSMEGDFVLCDGPAMSYSWILRGHRGFLENIEDQAGFSLAW